MQMLEVNLGQQPHALQASLSHLPPGVSSGRSTCSALLRDRDKRYKTHLGLDTGENWIQRPDANAGSEERGQ